MPAVDGRPLSSSDSSEDAILTPFEVSGLKLPAVDAMFHLLTLSPDENMGDDLRFWQIAARFTLELLARERYVPSIDDRLGPMWQPVLAGNDRGRFVRLARAMPPVCRATGTVGSIPSGTEVLESFLETTIDALCRQSLE